MRGLKVDLGKQDRMCGKQGEAYRGSRRKIITRKVVGQTIEAVRCRICFGGQSRGCKPQGMLFGEQEQTNKKGCGTGS
jgi:hypothetical protein